MVTADRQRVQNRRLVRTLTAAIGIAHHPVSGRARFRVVDVNEMVLGKVRVEREPEQPLFAARRNSELTERLVHELPLWIDDADCSGQSLVEKDPAIRRQRHPHRKVEPRQDGLQLQVSCRRLADREIERLRRLTVRQFIVNLIGQNETNAVGGRREPEDIERCRGFPVNEVRMNSVVADPVVCVDTHPVVKIVGHGIGIKIKVQVILSRYADRKELRHE